MNYYIYEKNPFGGQDLELEIIGGSRSEAIEEAYQCLKGSGWDKDYIAERIVSEDEI